MRIIKFEIGYTEKLPHQILQYIDDEYSFLTEPVTLEINFDLSIDGLNFSVIDDDNRLADVWGFCPEGVWKISDVEVPKAKTGILSIKNDLEPGFTYRIYENYDTPIYYNPKTEWICVGKPEASGEAVEFIPNCIAVIHNKELMAVWLKPVRIPTLNNEPPPPRSLSNWKFTRLEED